MDYNTHNVICNRFSAYDLTCSQMFCPRQTTSPKPYCIYYNNRRTYYIARDVQVPAPALYSTAWSDCVVTLAGRSSAVRLDPCARRLRIVRVPWGSYCRANKKTNISNAPDSTVHRKTTANPISYDQIHICDFGYTVYHISMPLIFLSPRIPAEITFLPYASKV